MVGHSGQPSTEVSWERAIHYLQQKTIKKCKEKIPYKTSTVGNRKPEVHLAYNGNGQDDGDGVGDVGGNAGDAGDDGDVDGVHIPVATKPGHT